MVLFVCVFYFTIKRINKGLKLDRMTPVKGTHFTIKRINKGLKLAVLMMSEPRYFTIKRINKGLKRFAGSAPANAILP